jgi:hypothetical protein
MNDIDGKSPEHDSFHNRGHMTPGMPCGGYHCLAVFPGDDVHQWIDDDLTALCPRCGIDAVVPGLTDTATLRDPHEHAPGQSSEPSASEWDVASHASDR